MMMDLWKNVGDEDARTSHPCSATILMISFAVFFCCFFLSSFMGDLELVFTYISNWISLFALLSSPTMTSGFEVQMLFSYLSLTFLFY